MHFGIPYVDGATDGFRGKVMSVLGDGACLQCAMNRTHMAAMERRFTCTGRGTTVFTPRTAAEITTTSVIAAMQVREAVKIASGRQDLCVRGASYYDGVSGALEALELDVDTGCPNHG
jgi:molybdopterin-synthase adenylyltransferase